MDTPPEHRFVRRGSLSIGDPYDIEKVVHQQRLRFLTEVRQPLVLISQIQRSGGTLVSQLLDGHSELHVHPGELHIGRPNKYSWPELNLALSAAELFDSVVERTSLKYARLGFNKLSPAEANFDPNVRDRVLPFIFDAGLQKKIFQECLAERPARTQREVLDCYITSYFNAWLDYRGLYRDVTSVKYWVAFAARLLTQPGNIQRFLSDYPDGKAIAIVRNPVSWFASARRHSNEYEELSVAMGLWMESNSVLLEALRNYSQHVMIVEFEELVSNLRRVMCQIANFIGIQFDECLLQPTFNGMHIASDSSFGSKMGIDMSSVDRSYDVDTKEIAVIEQMTGDLYASLCALAKEQARLYG